MTAAPIQPNLPTVAALRRLAHAYLRGNWPVLLAGIGLMVLTAATNTGLAYLLDPAVKQLFLDKNPAALTSIPLEVFAVLALRAACTYGQQSLLESLGERVVAASQRDMFASLMRTDLASLNAVHSGQFVSNFLYDATLLRDAITKGLAAAVLEMLTLIGLVGVMIYEDWKLTIFSVIVVPLIALTMNRIMRSLRRASARSMEETALLTTVLTEALDGRRVVKAYGLEDHAAQRLGDRLAQRLRFLLKAVRRRAAAMPAADVFMGMVVAGTLYYAGYQIVHKEVELNQLMSFIGAMILALQPVRNLSAVSTFASTGMAAAGRVFSVIDRRPTIVDAHGAQPLVIKRGAVAFSNVSFAYLADKSATAIANISLEIPAGGKIALVGPSGAGKTTIFNLLLRFYDIDAGRIDIDGQDIHGVTIASLRRAIALVTQESILFDETVADNIALGRLGATRPEIEAAARNAAAHDFIMALPLGYDTRVGEGGLKLSGGQRQRVAIARAMLRDAPILLLDEATSALDTESERQVQEALARLMKDRTTIVIAHRLSTVVDADCIYVIDKGRVVERGRHGELMARGGLYARLYQHDLAEEAARA